MPNLVFVAQFISARVTKAGGEFRPPTCYVTRAVLMRKHVRSFEVNISQLTAFILTQESVSVGFHFVSQKSVNSGFSHSMITFGQGGIFMSCCGEFRMNPELCLMFDLLRYLCLMVFPCLKVKQGDTL